MTEPTGMIADLIKVQKAIKPIAKDSKANAGKFSYTYADLGSVLEAVLPPLHEHGFVLMQPVAMSDLGEAVVRTTLYHVSGDKIESAYPVRVADPADPQKVGGGVTFARRYSLLSLLALATEDDDAGHARTPRARSGEPEYIPDPNCDVDAAPPEFQRPASNGNLASEPQRKKIYAMYKGLEWTDEQAKEFMRDNYQIDSSRDLTKANASHMIKHLGKLEGQVAETAPF